jgi:lipooligosaccharide transport system ATP-binding protein
LISEHIEPDVIEVYDDNAAGWANGQDLAAMRMEVIGETAFFYGKGLAALEERLDTIGLRYVRRPANLEDVFLKLTGRELRD